MFFDIDLLRNYKLAYRYIDFYTKIMRSWAKIYYLESLKQTIFKIFNGYEFGSNDLQVLYVNNNIYFFFDEK